MPKDEVSIAISSNNEKIEKIFLDSLSLPEVKFVKEKNKKVFYSLYLIDLSEDLSHISQNIIDIYNNCRIYDSKLALVLIHGLQVDIEKNHYFQKMLENLGKNDPLHRLIFTKDVYQYELSTPVTYFDHYLSDSINNKKINISQKGENTIYPLSFKDLTQALLKTLFLSNTSGKTFWLLGDPLFDLDIAYLLKKYISNDDQEDLEINASLENDPKLSSLANSGNKSRAELNWNPKDNFSEDVKRILEIYIDQPTPVAKKESKKNYLYQFLTWVYRPKPKKKSQLPFFNKFLKRGLYALIIVAAVYSATFVAITFISLQQLETSVNQALSGNLQNSVDGLNEANRFKAIGEPLLNSATPILNLFAPKETEKIYNLYAFINYSASSLENLHQTYVIADSLYQSLNSQDKKINYDDLGLALHSNLSQVYENLNQIRLLSATNKLPLFISQKIINNPNFKNLKTLEEQISQYIKIADIIPALLSGNQSRTILVLLQNSQIISPNGGKVDSYLLLTLDQGNLISKIYYSEEDLQKHYQENNQTALKNKRFTSAPTPQPEDLIQNPNFPEASLSISDYLDKALKTKPDFVIAINNHLIENLLSEEKSNSLDQFKLKLSQASGSAEYQNEFDSYLNRLFSHDISLPVLGRVLAKEMGDNQILIWSADINIENLIITQAYSGAVIQRSCSVGLSTPETCRNETLYLSEKDIQDSRAILWSDRLLKHTVSLQESFTQHQIQIDYQPISSPITQSVQVEYYLYLTSPSTVDQVLLNELPTSMKTVEKTTENNLDIYKIPVVLQTDQNNTLIIKATAQSSQASVVPYSYSITEYRQPGTIDNGINLTINYPENLRPTIITSSYNSEPHAISLTLPKHTFTFGLTLDHLTQ